MKLIKALFWTIVIAGAITLAGIALHYFDFDTEKQFLGSKQSMLSNPIWVVVFYVHLGFGAIATLLGIPLFFPKLIHFRSNLHKQLGKVYIVSILLLSGPTGIYLSFFAEGGSFATLGFTLMALAWMVCTYIALDTIIRGDVEAHRKWITRSYAMTLSGVSLRLYTPIGAEYFDYELNFIISAYLPWIINLFLAEGIIIYQKLNPQFVEQHLKTQS